MIALEVVLMATVMSFALAWPSLMSVSVTLKRRSRVDGCRRSSPPERRFLGKGVGRVDIHRYGVAHIGRIRTLTQISGK